ncbi:hypothetical protein WJX73_010278 [Symbiochloris irregularis]|uniref:Uncharacterized protein n=1 Tax=Symbiochloris irregularis TaxID=706552 RepID=A0AAW1NUE9_9CHLO
MARVYVGGIAQSLAEKDLEDEFIRFGTLRSVWVARKPPGFAFIEFEDVRDAEDAIRKLDGLNGWRVELSRKGERGPPRGGGGYGDRDRHGGGGRDYDRQGGDRFGGQGGYGGRGGGMRSEMRCYECGETGHFARDCRERIGGGAAGGGGGGGGPRSRPRSRTPPRRRSPSEPRRRSRSASYGRSSPAPRRSRSYERSPAP